MMQGIGVFLRRPNFLSNCDAVFLKGGTIGQWTIVAANFMVTKNASAYTSVVGNPARTVGESRP
jgi:acetyltransferase-like isoleucine patch superfamily enzyme